jgi:hypothetical protein
MWTPHIRGGLSRQPQPNYAVAGVLVATAGVALVVTWNAVPWNWAFAAFYVGLALLLELGVRVESGWATLFVQAAILGGTAPFVIRWFVGEAWAENTAAVHLAAIAMLSVAVGVLLGQQLRRRVQPPRS